MRNVTVNILSASDATTQIGNPIDTGQWVSASFQFVFSDTGVDGSVKVQGSNDFAVNGSGTISGTFTPTNWEDIPNASATITSGSSALITIAQTSYRWMRTVFTRPTPPSSGANIEVPIEVESSGVASLPFAAYSWIKTRTTLDTTDYDGTVTYSFEVDASNVDSADATIMLADSANAVKATVTIPAGTTAVTRFRGTWTPTAGANDYRLRTSQTTSLGDLSVFGARILVQQVGATKTKIFVPLTASDYAMASHNDDDGDIFYSSDTNWTTGLTGARYSPLWIKDSSVWSTITGNAFTFEAVINVATAGQTGYAALYNETSNAVVTDSVVSTTSATGVLMLASFADNAANFNNGDTFGLRVKTNGSTNMRVLKAGLWIKLTAITKGEVYYMVARSTDTVGTDQTIVQQRVKIDTSIFSTPTVYFDASGWSNLMLPVSNTSGLYDDGVADSGTAGLTLVTGSQVTVPYGGETARNRVRSGALTITSGDRFVVKTTYDNAYGPGFNYTVSKGFVVVAFNAPPAATGTVNCNVNILSM